MQWKNYCCLCSFWYFTAETQISVGSYSFCIKEILIDLEAVVNVKTSMNTVKFNIYVLPSVLSFFFSDEKLCLAN